MCTCLTRRMYGSSYRRRPRVGCADGEQMALCSRTNCVRTETPRAHRGAMTINIHNAHVFVCLTCEHTYELTLNTDGNCSRDVCYS